MVSLLFCVCLTSTVDLPLLKHFFAVPPFPRIRWSQRSTHYADTARDKNPLLGGSGFPRVWSSSRDEFGFVDEQIHRGKLREAAIKAVGGAGGIELAEHPGDRGEQHIVADADGAMAQGLGDVAFTGAAGTHDQHADLLLGSIPSNAPSIDLLTISAHRSIPSNSPL